MRTLILASNSPRRSELLALLRLPFEVYPADIAEVPAPEEPPVDYVLRLARHKAAAIAADQPGLVVAADTTVVDGGELLEKPADPTDARRMLQQLRGRVHQVYTGIALLDADAGRSYDAVCCTQVPMRHYSDAEIDAYIATDDPLDKAGAYGIQHAGFHPVEGLRGCFASVMGLPLCHLMVGLRTFIADIPGGLPHRCQGHLNYDCPAYQAILGQS
ncbi:MAG: Maf family protein [Brevefilum sp.]|nr:Maf family protein [Brevefilum sp.]